MIGPYRSVVVEEGRSVELKCYASGYPQPKIYWRRQDNAILPTNTSILEGNVLKFPSVKKEHRGTYFCVATNVVGTGARRNVDVEVTFAPILKVERSVPTIQTNFLIGIFRSFENGASDKTISYFDQSFRFSGL